MYKNIVSLTPWSFMVITLVIGLTDVSAQAVNTTVQLPSIRIFGIRTVVSVPDGGTMFLGGTKSYSGSSTTRGTLPFRPFSNRSSGYNASATGSSVSAMIISQSEVDEDLTARGNYLLSQKSGKDVNGSPATQKKAAFITRNIGRSSVKRSANSTFSRPTIRRRR